MILPSALPLVKTKVNFFNGCQLILKEIILQLIVSCQIKANFQIDAYPNHKCFVSFF